MFITEALIVIGFFICGALTDSYVNHKCDTSVEEYHDCVKKTGERETCEKEVPSWCWKDDEK